MHKNGSSSGSIQPKLSAGQTEKPSGWRSGLWAVAAIALLLFPLFMINSVTQAATDVSGDAFPIRQCFVRDRINKITNNEMVARFDGLNQSGDPETIYFSASGLKWVEYSDGSARLMGDMIAIGGGAGFTVDVTFTNKAIANGNLEYDSFFGTLTGLGDYAGAELSVQAGTKTPSFRFWNNGPDAEGWMQWVVNQQSTGGELITEAGPSGVWSFSINPNCKTMPAPTYTPVKVPGSIGDRVWKDNNANGIQDADELDKGVAGIDVLLWVDDDGNGTRDRVIATQTTDSNGDYLFQGLSTHDTYYVQFIIPADAEKLFTTQGAGSDGDVDSDPDPATGITGPINIDDGEDKDDVDAGLINSPASIGDRVWRDTNRNGIQDGGEPGEDGVTVILLTGGKDILDSTVTANGGQYSFSNLNPKEVYRIRFEAPADTGFTEQGAGANGGADSDAAQDTGQTDPISLSPGEINDDIDAGIVNDFVTIGDRVWSDTDKDGVQDAGEPGIAGIVVNLLDKGGNEIGSTTTDADGNYTFSVDPKLSYIIEVEVPDDKEVSPKDASPDDTADSDIGDDGRTDPIQPTPGDDDTTIDAGLFNRGASIGDTIFEDRDSDGIQDPDEDGIGGVTVNLLGKDGTLIASDTTDAAGKYSFTDLDPDLSYIIEVVIPDGKDASPKDRGPDDTKDSDIGDDGKTDFIELAPGEDRTDIDGGLVNEPAIIGGEVFQDSDGDGIQDPGEPGVGGVTVNLLDKGKGVVDTAITAADGSYSFSVSPKQSYIIEVEEPGETIFTEQDQGPDDETDSDVGKDDGRTDPIQPTAGETDDTIDAGIIPIKSTIGDRVWKDDNGNGIQDNDEPGIEDVTVNLLDKAGNIVDTTVTDPNGIYGFSVDSTDSYVVQVVVPAGKGITTKDAGDDEKIDSDIGPDGKTDFITIGPNDSNPDIDAGLVNLPGSINGVVFNDANKNGIRDAGEELEDGVTVQILDEDKTAVLDSDTTSNGGAYTFPGLNPKAKYVIRFSAPVNTAFTEQDAGGDDTIDSDANKETGQTDPIEVPADGSVDGVDAGVVDQPGSITGTLFKDDDGDGIQDEDEPGIPDIKVSLTDKAGNPIATATTDDDGNYSFLDIDPGDDYVVEFTPVPDTVFTTQDSGDDDDIDSDVAPDTGRTDSITVPANGTADNIDAGVVWIPGTLTGTVFDDTNRNGIQDGDEPGREDVTVNLLNKDGSQVATTQTNGNGDYSFSGLDPKVSYIVEVEEPAGKDFTDQDVGDDDTIDSDVAPDTGQTDFITVPANDTKEDVDAGVINEDGSISGEVFNDKNQNGIQEAGEEPVPGVTVELISKDGNTVYQTTTTDDTGAYSFNDVDTKISYRVRFTEPENQNFSPQDQGDDDTVDSDPDPTTGVTGDITVPAGGSVEDVDAGVSDEPGSISGTVFKDTDRDGIQDDDEPGVEGVSVNLQDKAGNKIANTTTDENGDYSFPDVDSNQSYVIKFTEPEDTGFSPQDIGDDDTVDSDPNPETGVTGFIDVPANGSTTDVDAGLLPDFGTITGEVFEDADRDGIQDDDGTEPGVEGVVVNLLDEDGNIVDTTTTDENGEYTFDDIDPEQTYFIDVEEPDNKDITDQDVGDDDTIDSDVNPENGQSDPINIEPGGTADVDTGVVNEGGEITGVVWNDVNDNGLRDDGEPEVEGVLVELISKDGNTVFEEDITGPDGSYALFVENPKVSYRVRFTAPDGVDFTTPDAVSPAAEDEGDSDADPVTGETADITVPAGGTVDNVDAGLDSAGKAGGVVWKDNDGDGEIDDDEPRLEDIVVRLLTKDFTEVMTTTTTEDGTYSFPGIDTTVTYIVEVVAPDDKDFTDKVNDSDVDPDTGRSDPVTVDPDGITPVDAGLRNKPGTVNGRVWNDENGNGIQDDGEAGVAGVTVQLVSEDKTEVVVTTTTDANGNYSITVEDPKKNYRIRVTQPENQNFTEQDAGDDDTIDSDVAGDTGQTEPFSVSANDSTDNVDAGVRDAEGKTGGVVWKDDDGDGVQDSEEPTLEGITVNLLDKDKGIVATTKTDENGTYSFPGIDSTVSYIVEVVAPDDKDFTEQGAGDDPTIDSDVDPDTGRSEFVEVDPNGRTDVDAGLQNKPGTVNGRVWNDINGNGIQDDGEPGVAGVTVQLVSEDKTEVVETVTTDADGNYSITVEDPKKNYRIRVTEPDAQDFTTPNVGDDDTIDSDVAGDTGQTEPFSVDANDSTDNVDAGVRDSDGKAGGVVFKDDNGDGLQDPDEETLKGIKVRLLAKDGTLIAETETDENGEYSFPGVDSTVSYVVEFVLPDDKLFTEPGGDSDVDPATGKSPSVVVPADGRVDVSAGLVNKSGTIGDTVFKDDNENGIQDAGEGGVENVTVRLLGKDGIEIATDTTDANGEYGFTVDPKKSYIIEVVEPEGYNFSPKEAPGSTPLNDSNVDPATGQTDQISVGPDETDDSIDAGLVWEPGTIVGTVFKDNNKNGIQDADEPGIEDVEVKLWIKGTSGNLYAAVETDSNGDYVFTNVNPKLSYNVQIVVPDDKDVTEPDVENNTRDDEDSDIGPDGTSIEPVRVDPDGTTDIDAGLFNKSASIGGRAWNDSNRDGIQDPGEPGQPGVEVELQTKDGTVIDTVTTDSDGNYIFVGVDPKEVGYIVSFAGQDGKDYTTPNAGDGTNDSDANSDGKTDNIAVEADEDNSTTDVGYVTTFGSISGTVTKDGAPEAGVTVQLQEKDGTVITAVTTDASGDYEFDELDADKSYVVVVIAPDGKKFPDGEDGTSGNLDVAPGGKTTFDQDLQNKPATIGDLVFKDDNQNGIWDSNEPGIPGITVNLLDKDKGVLDTTTTDADGKYEFTDVDPKVSYIIEFELPADKEFTTPDVNNNGNDTEDSDVIDTDQGRTDIITVEADETDSTIDAGMVNKGASVGDYVWRDLNNDGIQDANEPGVEGVVVNLQLKDGTFVATDTTDADGRYDFIDIDPKQGYEVEFVAPADINGIPETFTETDVNGNANDDIDSDATADGTTDGSIDVAAGENNTTVDAGLATRFDLALKKTIGEAEKLVLDGDEVIFQIEVCNQGNVPANSIKIVDYIPGAFVLVDADWTDEGTQATYVIDGPLAPGACEMIEITLEAAFSPARSFEFVSNKAEIYEAKDEGGNVLTSDVDSTYDRVELNDPVIDDETNLTPAQGDEDDHDKAIVQVLPRDLGTSGDVNADGQRTAVDALFILQNDVGINDLPVSVPGRSGAGTQEDIDAWCANNGAFDHNDSTVSGDFDGDDDCDGEDYGAYVCDVSGDDRCNSIDALFILQCDVGLSNAFCAQP